jgi:hypothetical protein
VVDHVGAGEGVVRRGLALDGGERAGGEQADHAGSQDEAVALAHCSLLLMNHPGDGKRWTMLARRTIRILQQKDQGINRNDLIFDHNSDQSGPPCRASCFLIVR